MRTFIAIDIFPQTPLLNFIQTLRKDLSDSNINWVNPKIFHLTLAFLGEIDESKSALIRETLRKVAGQHGPFEVEIKGFGYFGSAQQPRVLWIGISPNNTLLELQSEIAKDIKLIGIGLEERQFHPHITLGRVKDFTNFQKLKSIVNVSSNINFQKTAVDQIVFYESRLRPQGPIYSPIETFPFHD